MSAKVVTLDEVIVQSPGQRQALSNTPLMVYSVTVQNVYTNTGYQYIGDSRVTSSNGHIFEASDVMEIDGPLIGREQEEFDISEIYVDSSTSEAKFRVSAWIRK